VLTYLANDIAKIDPQASPKGIPYSTITHIDPGPGGPLVDADGKLSVGSSVKNKVQAEILDQVKGDTVIAYKQKRRKGFHKKKGHRTAYTKIKVIAIA